jgi:methylmalonyl-CoA/ethylmalonyl-CoA epimerase
MLKLSHIAIATPKIEEVAKKLKALAMEIETTHSVPSERVTAAMIPVGVSEHFRIELLEPTSTDSPIAKFLEKKPSGGLHHICFEVTQLERWLEVLQKAGMEVLAPGIRKAARGRALFIHPKSIAGVLVELEEITTSHP